VASGSTGALFHEPSGPPRADHPRSALRQEPLPPAGAERSREICSHRTDAYHDRERFLADQDDADGAQARGRPSDRHGTQAEEANKALAALLDGKLTFTPTETPEGRRYAITGKLATGALFHEIGRPYVDELRTALLEPAA
jgi:hypothetical protein